MKHTEERLIKYIGKNPTRIKDSHFGGLFMVKPEQKFSMPVKKAEKLIRSMPTLFEPSGWVLPVEKKKPAKKKTK